MNIEEIKALHPKERIELLEKLIRDEESKEESLDDTITLFKELMQEAESELGSIDEQKIVLEEDDEKEVVEKKEETLEEITEDAPSLPLKEHQAYVSHLAHEPIDSLYDKAKEIREKLYQNPGNAYALQELETFREAVYEKGKEYSPDKEKEHLMTSVEKMLKGTYDHTKQYNA
jgi:hypothetical protein